MIQRNQSTIEMHKVKNFNKVIRKLSTVDGCEKQYRNTKALYLSVYQYLSFSLTICIIVAFYMYFVFIFYCKIFFFNLCCSLSLLFLLDFY